MKIARMLNVVMALVVVLGIAATSGWKATAWGGYDAMPNGAPPGQPAAQPPANPPASNPGRPTTGAPLVNHLADIYGLLVAGLLLFGVALFSGGWALARRKVN